MYNIRENKITFIAKSKTEYPNGLRNIYDAPNGIYAIGNLELLNSKSIAIIGSRACSPYGRYVAERISYILGKCGYTIISGMARGIDTYSHIGAIRAGAKTIAVLGSGINYIYPPENKKLYYEILRSGGAIVSEYPIGSEPKKKNFPARNRIISAMSEKIIVVEAGEKSGCFSTVDFALEDGKDVYAVPR